jgi:hypothetical protein
MMKSFILKIFAIQLVASVLLFLGIQQLYVLAELDLIELIHSVGKDNFAYYVQKSDEFGISEKLKALSTTKFILSSIGIILGYIICSIINFKKGYNWTISLVIVVLCFIVFQFKFINLPTKYFINSGLEIAYIGTSIVAIIISLLIYFYSYRAKP